MKTLISMFAVAASACAGAPSSTSPFVEIEAVAAGLVNGV